MAKQTIKQRKAIRSAAAKKGWETRIARERREIEAKTAAEEQAYALAQEALRRERDMNERMQNAYRPSERQPTWDDVSGIPDILRGAPPKPSLWQRIKRWFA